MAEYERLPDTFDNSESEVELEKSNSSDQKPTAQNAGSFVILLTLFSTIGGFLFGYDTGVVSGALLLIKEEFNLSAFWQEFFVSITIGFAAVFALLSGPINEKLGRRPVIIIASVIFTVGAFSMAAAFKTWMLFTGRAIVGAGIGL